MTEAAAHKHPNYMGVFWWLLALTIIELGVIYLPISKMAIAIMLIVLAVTKAVLVALYFMHLKFERVTLAGSAEPVHSLRVSYSNAVAGYLPPLISTSELPTLNAALNSLSAVFLCAGYLFIRAKNIRAHRACMLTAFASSTSFSLAILSTITNRVRSLQSQGWIRPSTCHPDYPYFSCYRRGGRWR